MVRPLTYRFRNVQGGLYLDEDEGIIRGWSNDPKRDNQKWVLVPDEDGWNIKNVKTGLYASSIDLSVDHGLKATSIKSVWCANSHGTGYSMYLRGAQGLQVIELFKGEHKNGTPVNIVPWIPDSQLNAQQLWELEEVMEDPQLQDQYKGPIPAGTYRIHNTQTNTALALDHGKKDEGTRVSSWYASAGPHQSWIFELGSNGYHIKNGSSGRYLHYEDPKVGSGLTCRSEPVEWTVTQADRGHLIHIAKEESILVMELDNGDKNDGAKVSLQDNDSERKENQKWRIELVA
ncbi:hypothetical protein FS837_006181 [Tulasnella sp. UAMH 9824]|nr:hypothetical protein FS837_006181 [Tulasnella sp. UAMH 9824]